MNIPNSIVMFTFSVLDWKYLFGKIQSKKSKLSVKMKFGTKTNWNMQNSMVLLTFSAFDIKVLMLLD